MGARTHTKSKLNVRMARSIKTAGTYELVGDTAAMNGATSVGTLYARVRTMFLPVDVCYHENE